MVEMSQRRKLSNRGRVIAAGLSIGAAGVLATAMAITDSSAGTTPATITNDAGTASSGSTASPYTPSYTPSQQTPAQQVPTRQTPTFQPRTRTGGS